MEASAAAAAPGADKDQRILILAPQGRDASLAEAALARAGLSPHICADLAQLRREIAIGAGSALIAEEALPRDNVDTADALVGSEPNWSTIPLVVLLGRSVRPRKAPMLRGLESRPNVTFLERPVPKRTLVSALRTAVEARRLQYSVRDALVSYAEATAALKEADHRKDEFLATLAHELRNPLAPIRNAVYVLGRLDYQNPASGARASTLVEMVGRQVDHLVRLVDDLLEISRITSGKIMLQKQRADLRGIILQAIETSGPLINGGRHELEVSLGDQAATVDGDPVRLAQVFSNLLNNAAKYTPAGGRIKISLDHRDREAIVSVRDNGIGIVPAMLPRVFDIFAQSPSALGREQRGIGIGLALARSIVELHEGNIEAESPGAGQGSEFVVRLPLASSGHIGEHAQSEKPALPFHAAHRVLVVDDNRDVANSLVMLLESLGEDARAVYSGAEALAAVADFKPHFAFLDIGMPGMDGYETARRIRLLPGGDSVVLVALSGWAREDNRRSAAEAGVDHHFAKPIALDAVKALLAGGAPAHHESGLVAGR